ncbi:MAG: hypothetical protein J0I29_13225 [Rhizobiales bacterium]|nr:hypothetical protein [Hyphomicrobiales bacterium]
MLHIIFAILSGGGLFLLAGATRNHGWFIADQVCLHGAVLCDNPSLIVTTGSVLVIFAAVHLMVRN